jgi:hypothetical protein
VPSPQAKFRGNQDRDWTRERMERMRSSMELSREAEEGHVLRLQMLLEIGADVNTTSHLPSWVLAARAAAGHPVNASDLLTAASAYNATPIYIACHRGHIDAVYALADAGADIHMPPTTGVTPLCIACLNGHLEVVRYLCRRGADVMARAADGVFPLLAACRNGHLEVVQLLLTYPEVGG